MEITMLTCIYCETEKFENGEGSEEHVILSSLGGKKVSKNICCQICNNKYGDEIDEDLSKELSFFSTMLGITTGRNKPAPTHNKFVTHLDKDHDLTAGGAFKLSKADVEINERADVNGHEISITAANEKQALKILNQVLGKFNMTIDDFQSLDAKSVRSYLPTINQRISLGRGKHLRSMAKMMLTYAATLMSPERLRSGCFDTIIEFIKGNNPSYDGIKFDTVTPFPAKPAIDEINHRIFFVASETSKLAIGLIELYGKLRFSAVLSEKWEGPALGKGYAVDPVSGCQSNIEFDVNDELFSSLNERYLDLNTYKKSVGQLIEIFQNRQSDQIISEITKNAINRYMVGKDEFITEEMITKVSQEVALEFVKFLQRIESAEHIDLKNKI